MFHITSCLVPTQLPTSIHTHRTRNTVKGRIYPVSLTNYIPRRSTYTHTYIQEGTLQAQAEQSFNSYYIPDVRRIGSNRSSSLPLLTDPLSSVGITLTWPSSITLRPNCRKYIRSSSWGEVQCVYRVWKCHKSYTHSSPTYNTPQFNIHAYYASTHHNSMCNSKLKLPLYAADSLYSTIH